MRTDRKVVTGMYCPCCGTPLASNTALCPSCGACVRAEPACPRASCSAAHGDRAREEQYAAVIGSNAAYYLAQFRALADHGRAAFHWSAFLFLPIFLFYRKCDALFFRYALVPCALTLIGLGLGCAVPFSDIPALPLVSAVIGVVGVCALLAASLWMGANFNRLYLVHCDKVLAGGDRYRCGTSTENAVCFGLIAVLCLVLLTVSVVFACSLSSLLASLSPTVADAAFTPSAHEQAAPQAAPSPAEQALAPNTTNPARYLGTWVCANRQPLHMEISYDTQTEHFSITASRYDGVQWAFTALYDATQNALCYTDGLCYTQNGTARQVRYADGTGRLSLNTFTDTVFGTALLQFGLLWEEHTPDTTVHTVQLTTQAALDQMKALSYPEDDSTYTLDTERITPSALAELSREQCMWLRNEIYARHGYVFQTPAIGEHFAQYDWYAPDPTIPRDIFYSQILNDVERENVQTIRRYEKSRGW